MGGAAGKICDHQVAMETAPSSLTSAVSEKRRKEGSPGSCGNPLPGNVRGPPAELGQAPGQPVSPLSVLLQMESVKLGMDQKLVEGQEKLHQMWLSWNQKPLQGTERSLEKPEVSTVGRAGVLRAGPSSPPTCLKCFPSLASQ